MTNLKRIIDANLNRATEASRVIEEISRFLLDDEELSKELKYIRHELNMIQEQDYDTNLNSRDTENDVGVKIKSPSERLNIENIFKANIKRLQQALRVLSEYSVENDENRKIFETLRYNSYTLEKKMWDKLKNRYNQIKLNEKKLYLVTNSDCFESEDEFLDAVASSLSGGVDILQLREKKKSAKETYELGKKIKALCAQFGVTFIINDRIDIAAMLEADGVHLGQDDLDVRAAREILGENAIVGISTHAPEQALKAVQDGADYIGVGPVFATPTKEGRIPVGLEYVKWAEENIEIPFFAIGGIDKTNVNEVIKNGAKKIAVVRAIINSENPSDSAEFFRSKL